MPGCGNSPYKIKKNDALREKEPQNIFYLKNFSNFYATICKIPSYKQLPKSIPATPPDYIIDNIYMWSNFVF